MLRRKWLHKPKEEWHHAAETEDRREEKERRVGREGPGGHSTRVGRAGELRLRYKETNLSRIDRQLRLLQHLLLKKSSG